MRSTPSTRESGRSSSLPTWPARRAAFQARDGFAPMDCLTQWRLQIARDLLEEQDLGIAAVAQAVGYESESAFSVAFTEVVKLRPGAYQKSVQAPAR